MPESGDGMWRMLAHKSWCGCEAGAGTRHAQVWTRREESKVPENYAYLQDDIVPRVHGDERAIDRIEAWAKDVNAAGLTIVGPTGAGKTTAAVYALNAWIEATDGNERVFFVEAADLAVARRNAKLGKEANIIRKACNVGLLVLDDVGSEPSDPTKGLEHVVSKRYASGKPTIYTTWCTLEELAVRYDGGRARRVFDRATLIELRGPK